MEDICKGCGQSKHLKEGYCYLCKTTFKDRPEPERILRIREQETIEHLWDLIIEMNPDYVLELIDESCMSVGCRCGGEDSHIEWQ